MKKTHIYLLGLILSAGLMIISSCEERLKLDYTPYEPAMPGQFSYPDKAFYPVLSSLASDTPVINIDNSYTIRVDTVYLSEGAKCNPSKFSVDNVSGVITYDNKGGTIGAGDYTIDLLVFTANYRVKVPGAYKMTILDVPALVSASVDSVSVGALYAGEISKVIVTDETEDNSLVVQGYALSPEQKGYSIDATGIIKKTTEAPADTTIRLSVKVTTNLGVVTSNGLVKVVVGPPPTLTYNKTAGGKLSKVTVSPHSKYITAVPDLSDMSSDGGWELYSMDEGVSIPEGITIDQTDGKITVDAETKIIPDGTYSLGVKVTNASGTTFPFGKQFDVVIFTDWDNTQVVYSNNFQDEISNQPLDVYPELKGYDLTGTGLDFRVAHWVISGKSSEFYAMRLIDGDVNVAANTVALLSLAVKPEWVALKVSFNDFFGYGAAALNGLERTLSFSATNDDLESGALDPSKWTVLMAADSPGWVQTSGWGNNKTDADFNVVPAVELNGFDYTQPDVYLNWHFNFSDPATKGQYYIDALKVEAALTYSPIEE